MKVLLLSAGISKRMKPLSDKNFLEFLGKPLIQHQLESLQRNNLKEVIIIGGKHNMDKAQEIGEKLNMTIQICEQKDLSLGMAGAVLAARNFLDNDEILIFSGNDVVEDKALELVLEKRNSSSSENDALILAKKVDKYFPGGYLELDENSYIQNIIEKPEQGKEPSDLVNLVAHWHKNSDKLIKYLEKTETDKDDKYEKALSAMAKDGTKMKAVSYEGAWYPIKFPWHVQPVFNFLFENTKKFISKSAQISKNAIINGDVIIEDNVRILDGAVVNGPCYIGENYIIATNAFVRESNIGKNCVIGFSTEVARSFLGNDVWTHSNYVGDSVIGNNVSFGAGTITGNLRLDEKNIKCDYNGCKLDCGKNKFGAVIGDNVRVGVNTSFMPGVKIGSNSFIGAGIVVSENIPDKSFARAKIELKISENKCDITSDREDFKNKL